MLITTATKGVPLEGATASAAEFEGIYARLWPRVFAYAMVLTRQPEDAEDAAAEGFRRAYSAWTSGRPPAADPLPWLLLITRRVVLDEARRRRVIRWLPLTRGQLEAGRDDEAFRRTETWLWFEDLCRVVPARQREALLLRYQFDMDDRSIAEVLGVSQVAVRKLVSRGLAIVREHAEGR